MSVPSGKSIFEIVDHPTEVYVPTPRVVEPVVLAGFACKGCDDRFKTQAERKIHAWHDHRNRLPKLPIWS